jgi:hypothetical protein
MVGFPTFSLLYSFVLSDFVCYDADTGTSTSADKCTFAATSKTANQSSASGRATDGFGSIVVTLVVGILCCFSPIMFTLGYLLCPTERERAKL